MDCLLLYSSDYYQFKGFYMTRYDYLHSEVNKDSMRAMLGKYGYIVDVAQTSFEHKSDLYNVSLAIHSDKTMIVTIANVYAFKDAENTRVEKVITIQIGTKSKHATSVHNFYKGNETWKESAIKFIFSDWIVPTEKKLEQIIAHTF